MASDPKLLEAALDALPEPVIVWDDDGNAAFVNRAFTGAFSVGRKAVEGRPASTVEAMIQSRGHQTRERDSLPFGGPHHGGGRLEIFRNPSARHDPKRQEELLGIAAHDLRGILSNVRMYGGLLLGGRLAELEPRARHAVEVIVRNTDRALRLAQSWFDAARAKTGYLGVHAEAASLEQTLRDVVESRQQQALEKGVAIRNDAERLPPARFDKERTKTALMAFLDNALEREHEHGEIAISSLVEDQSVTLRFVDHGAPLTPEDQARLFDPEEQALRGRHLGTGFGMAVADSVAKTLGGGASATSDGVTTVFSLALPRAAPARVQ